MSLTWIIVVGGIAVLIAWLVYVIRNPGNSEERTQEELTNISTGVPALYAKIRAAWANFSQKYLHK